MKHIQFETNGLKVLVIEVGNDHYDFKMQESKYLYHGEFVLTYKSPVIWDKYGKESWKWNTKGNCTLHAVTDTMTEEQASVILERAFDKWEKFYGWKDYEDFYHYHDTWQESFNSLLRSKGIDTNKKHVILIQ